MLENAHVVTAAANRQALSTPGMQRGEETFAVLTR